MVGISRCRTDGGVLDGHMLLKPNHAIGAKGTQKQHFVSACVDRIWVLLPAEYRTLAEVLDLHADGLVSAEAIRDNWSAAKG